MASIPASIHFLSRLPIYREEKPYTIRYNLAKDSAVLRTNAYHEEIQNVPITDIRGRESLFTLSEHGFGVIKYEINMTHQDFADEKRVEEVYLPGVARRLRELLDAKHVQVYEHIIRRRDPEYPVSTGKPYTFDQPTNSAHIGSHRFESSTGTKTSALTTTADVTDHHITELVERIAQTLPPDVARCLKKHEVQCVNVWKPLRGPLTDWPLCVCDATSVDSENDFVPSDIVFTHSVVENIQVHHNPGQKWFYMSNQTPDELWIFGQSARSSVGRVKNGTPHCAFFDRVATPNGILRESIECRALVYFGDCANGDDD
ncbi:hypothetical protein LTS15_007711 [Exophiala xenobiotica]|nr:hypothetical protein LTS15_007711 [Exophiala xenobiotica]